MMASSEEQDQQPDTPQHSMIRISLLGTFEVAWEGQPFPPERLAGRGAAPALGLLKALLTQPDRFATRDWIMEQFWPESQHNRASERLDDVASHLRTLLRPPGNTAKILHYVYAANGKGSGYRLEGHPLIWVDAYAFTWYVEQAARFERFGHDALPLWERAYQLASRGEFLPEERYSDWTCERREFLAGLYRQCVHRLTTLLREQGAAEQAILRLRSYWQTHQIDEDVLRPLMELLGEQERYQEAEQYYQQCVTVLEEEGRVPDLRTQDLREVLRTKEIQRGRSANTYSFHRRDERPLPFSPIISQDIIGGRPTREFSSTIVPGLALESDNEAVKRREATKTIAAFGLQLLGLPLQEQFLQAFITTASVNEETLTHLEQLGDVCWRLANDSQGMMVAQIVSTFLPKLTLLAGQPSPYQQKIASLVARGYILAAEVEKKNVPMMQSYCEYAVTYSQITNDTSIQADALRQKATIALIAKEPSNAVTAYQQALPMVENVSPLLKSRIYLGTGSAYARSGQKQEALRYLGLARDSYPDSPKDDPAFLYLATSSDRAALHLYEALTYSDLQQPEDAWNALMQADGMHPKIPMVESTRIEFLNLQSKTAGLSGDMERSCTYLSASVKAAKKSGYEIWVQEAYEVYLTLCHVWPYEHQVKSLAVLFQ